MMIKKLAIGILAHVDAGKTTLSEALLYRAGALKKLGRVDHRDAFLDTDALERARGITIFSKQAVFMADAETEVTLLDTPGHVDFSAEAERTLDVLDCAVLVVSGTDGVQGHTRTLWRLLARKRVPVLLFVNKMDLPGTDRAALLHALQTELSDRCIDCGEDVPSDQLAEAAAVCDEGLLERYLAGEPVGDGDLAALTARRQLFPCFFGAALRLDGVDALLRGLARFCPQRPFDADFGAKVFKISRDGKGERLTHLRVTGGTLRVRDEISGARDGGWREKVSQLRMYSGEKFKPADEAGPGTVCAVTGLSHTRPGDGLGAEPDADAPVLAPVLGYRVLLPTDCDAHTMLQNLRRLEEEDPQLHVVWNEALGELRLQPMGEVQLEVLTHLIETRFGVTVGFDEGGIVYKETIAAPALGIGHFEPLRHYAEVQLLLEPGEPGSGVQLATACPTDALDLNWQRLILTHLAEREHRGVLIGAPITDLRITLLAGRAHAKHTEGGDFRQATYRAVRQGLMGAECVLLEPWYAFTLDLPETCLGRAMTDIGRMNGTMAAPEPANGRAVLRGEAPVSALRGYAAEVAAYTKGEGRLCCENAGYRPCHNAAEVIAQAGYDPEHDLENPPDSVFCAHGAGYTVKWDEVPETAHIQLGLRPAAEAAPEPPAAPTPRASSAASDAEAQLYFERTYGKVTDRGLDAFRQSQKARGAAADELSLSRLREDDYLLVDGYNIIFAWDELAEIARGDMAAAREALLGVLSGYKSVRRCHVIVVFDAYRVKGGVGSRQKQYGLDVVFTKEAETADMFIEQLSYDLSRHHRVRVATSDGMEQIIILGHGAQRLSANDLKWEVEQTDRHIADVVRGLAAAGSRPCRRIPRPQEE